MNISEPAWLPSEDDGVPTYTRSEALAVGALIDVSVVSADLGVRVPVAVTPLVWGLLAPSERDERLGQTVEGRLLAMLSALRGTACDCEAVVPFDVNVTDSDEPKTWRLQAVIGPGDDRKQPVVTIMFPHES